MNDGDDNRAAADPICCNTILGPQPLTCEISPPSEKSWCMATCWARSDIHLRSDCEFCVCGTKKTCDKYNLKCRYLMPAATGLCDHVNGKGGDNECVEWAKNICPWYFDPDNQK